MTIRNPRMKDMILSVFGRTFLNDMMLRTEWRAHNPQRLGQAFMNVLWIEDPKMYHDLSGTHADPWESDSASDVYAAIEYLTAPENDDPESIPFPVSDLWYNEGTD